jgi:ABC-type glycerol-3-phosphate transport system substrate-binding protein
MNKNSTHPDEAYRFIDWMLHDGQDYLINQKLQYCPSRTDLELNVNGLSDNGKDCLNFIVKQSESNVGGYREMPYADLKQAITDNLSTLALGDETPEEAASIIQSASEAQER